MSARSVSSLDALRTSITRTDEFFERDKFRRGRPNAGNLRLCFKKEDLTSISIGVGSSKPTSRHRVQRGRESRGQKLCWSRRALKDSTMEVQVEKSAEKPLEAWYMDDSSEDQRQPHRLNPNEPVSKEELEKLGVLHWVLDAEKFVNDPELEKIREDRNYSYQDIINVSPEKLPNYEQKIKAFFEEHIHTDEEIRYVLEGSGYFDIRDAQDRWIRMWTRKGDMIILPAGSYHRFTLDSDNFIKAMRLFIGEPVWTPFNRPQEENPVRKEYVQKLSQSQQSVEAH